MHSKDCTSRPPASQGTIAPALQATSPCRTDNRLQGLALQKGQSSLLAQPFWAHQFDARRLFFSPKLMDLYNLVIVGQPD
jgi:hypothetical protein